MTNKLLTPKEVAERYGVEVHSVLFWLKSGALAGIDVSRKAGAKRRTWRISEEALSKFELRRMHSPTPRGRPRKRRLENIIQRY